MNDVSRPRAYEKSDADPRLVAALALGTALFLLATPFLLMASYPGAARIGRDRVEPPQPPAPRLQVDPKADLDRQRSAELERLATFGWIDRDRKVMRIPIERAMQLLAERGLPNWPSSAPQQR